MNVEWIKLANFGEYKHPKGLQILNRSSAQAIVDSFHSIRGKFLRKFRGIPIFIGHPDELKSEKNNEKVYGRIENIKIEESALWILVKWTNVGYELFKNQILRYLSPRWVATPINDGKLIPERLLSVGMTNHPNIQCDHITKPEILSEEAVIDQIESPAEIALVSTSPEKEIPQPEETSTDGKAEEISIEEKEKSSTAGELQEEKIEIEEPESEKIGPTKFAINFVSKTQNLKQQTSDYADQKIIIDLVQQRMNKFSEKYYDAWLAVKRSQPTLFAKKF